MGDYRITYGFAYGRENNFYATTQGLITAGVGTPDVSVDTLLYTANTSNTTITHFDARRAGQIIFPEGKVITIVHLDTATSYTKSGVLRIGGTSGTYNAPINSVLQLLYHNSAWYEVSRGQGAGGYETVTFTVGGTGIINVEGFKTVFLNATAAFVLTGMSGGRAGQYVTLIPNSGGSAYGVTNSTNALIIGGTNALTLSLTAAYQFVCQNNTSWTMISPIG